MRKTTFAPGEYYHLYNRGVDKRTVFTRPAEYERFLAYLFLLNDTERNRFEYLLASRRPIWEAKPHKPLVGIGAYCLMPNHFHLYVTPLAEDGVSKFMQRVQTAYTMYFNKKHERSGALFQGTFKSQHVEREGHAKYLFSYIHLNPAKLQDANWKERGARELRELKKFLRDYPYSSLREYAQGTYRILNPGAFPPYLQRAKDLDEHISFWVKEGREHLGGLASQAEESPVLEATP